jgi:5'(3')-deoxyribonucleotidase
MSKKKIAIDIDDTIAASTESLRLRVNEKAGVSIPASGYQIPAHYWGYYERVWQIHDVDVELADFEKELTSKFNIIFITSRHHSWEAATRRWLKNVFSDIPSIDIYFTDSHHNAHGKSKGQLCKELKAKILIDDNAEHCRSAIDEDVRAILFGEYGWHLDVDKRIIRCKDWQAVLEYLDGER